MHTLTPQSFSSVYGPVRSWRYGRSLGIDPIGTVSTCSFDCVYCQLGAITHRTCDRHLFIPTEEILADLQPFAPWEVEVITLSGSGEPTLALNLGEILTQVKAMTGCAVGVLTNGSLLGDPAVRAELAIADHVALKLDAVTPEVLQRTNRPLAGLTVDMLREGFRQFRQQYKGHLAIQTMMMTPWSSAEQQSYLQIIREIAPNEIQLNTPTRPRPLAHQLEARENHLPGEPGYSTRSPKTLSPQVLREWGDRIRAHTGIAVRYPPVSEI